MRRLGRARGARTPPSPYVSGSGRALRSGIRRGVYTHWKAHRTGTGTLLVPEHALIYGELRGCATGSATGRGCYRR